MLDDRQRDTYAYMWVGSSPCEDCDKFHDCYENNKICQEQAEWRKKYEDRKQELLLSL